MKKMIFGLLDLEKPVIARINGDCIGLGATLALLCDISIAVEDARLGDPHVKMGYVAGDGGAIIWPQLVGFARAKEYLLTGDLLTAKEAERIGLINHAVPRAELDAKVNTLADKLANGATKAIKWTKTSINIPLRQLAHSMLDASLAYEALTNIGADHQEAVTAFQQKRKPKFTGR
jgi:enoyl-CoA hydratase